MTPSASRLLAQVAVATQIGPAELMAAPGRVFEHIVELVREQSEEADKEAAKMRHRDRLARLEGVG